MSKYKNWNIRDLIAEQLEITSEITARVRVVEKVDNDFHTCINSNEQDYKTLIESAIEFLRKGQKDE